MKLIKSVDTSNEKSIALQSDNRIASCFEINPDLMVNNSMNITDLRSLIASGIHNLVVHAVVRAVGPLTSESLVGAPLERRKHLLVIRSQVAMVLQMILEHGLMHGCGTLVRDL